MSQTHHKMINSAITIFLTINIILVNTSSLLDSTKDSKQIFCGSKLSEALSMVCHGDFYSPHMKKWYNLSHDEADAIVPDEDIIEVNRLDYPFVQKEIAFSFGSRRKRGIINECCRHPCDFKHLQLYCSR